MGSVKVKMNMAGVRKVFSEPAVTADLMRRGQAIVSEADSTVLALGYPKAEHHEAKVVTSRRSGAPVVLIRTKTHEAYVSQARLNTLTQALDAGRG